MAQSSAEFARVVDEPGYAGELDTSTLARALYSSDASLYRVVPEAVAYPRSTADLLALVDLSRRSGTPLTTRGAGTSCAGNAVGPGVVMDTRRHLNRVLSIDRAARTATVEPGTVHAVLQREATRHGLRFGPDPSTHTRCTIGGMVGNNACGPRAMGYGRTADNVVAADIVCGNGERLRVVSGEPAPDSPTLAALRELVADNLALIRTEFGRFGRQVSGYSLEHLLPENGFDVARFLAGTEGTLAVLTEITVRLVADAPHKALVALGYPTMADAGDDAVVLGRHSPTAAEGLDRRIVNVVARAKGPGAVPTLPEGDGWMLVELVDDDPDRLLTRAEALLADAHAIDGFVVADPAQALALWKIREDGAGLAGVSLERPAYGGWEDAAVPPERLGDYLRDFDALLRKHQVHGLPYGHFGDGCVHCRIDFPLDREGGADAYRAFVTEAAELVAGYGGSMSGEHGDGRARSALLPKMYSAQALALMGKVKQIFDPDNVLNPGVLVDPRPLIADLRVPQLLGTPLLRRDPELVEAVHQCSGVGKCIADTTASGGVMCPSYLATGEEKDSTRGRARVLQELTNGSLVHGWDSPAVHDALDLCLSCKGCYRDCPTGIDMASYKSVVTDKAYAGKLRPRSHYALGWLPRWGRLITASRLAPVVNLAGRLPGISTLLKKSAGVDTRRELPQFASGSARRRTPRPATSGRPIAVWVDSFSDCFDGTGLEPLLEVLVAAGWAPQLVERNACCGLTWISTGQREGARRQLRAALEVLHPIIAAGTPVIGVEPSCTAVWRTDALELLPDDPRVPEVAAGILTLAEVLTRSPEWQAPDLSGVRLVAQPHCHHASVLGWQTDQALLARTGAEVTTVGGCCGLAGNFGVEEGHYEVSVKVAEHDLLPAVRAAGPDAVVLADGFSCRLQLEQLEGRRAITLAELLADSARPVLG
ncbi:FAD-binding oxidoreductase [Enemella evansiae]|uniref:FAD-binding oxidoreductase n=1 Tax=Enemella evansiae TaxID=2016499 RepID=A0A255FYF9_9ACTN|nr:FAD-binding and (Fe-S)-binding domain-containing protein [Enemella evansiae]OYO08709.1 FAD-binding oxidoreductase [Enemella evansiae]OYO11370.1 FAD-binding oxidoreductase [Enemella evansiae]